jgi:hypothetical protein
LSAEFSNIVAEREGKLQCKKLWWRNFFYDSAAWVTEMGEKVEISEDLRVQKRRTCIQFVSVVGERRFGFDRSENWRIIHETGA